MGNILLSEGAIIFYIVVIIGAFILYALDLINNELRERNLESLLFKKFEVDEYIKVVSEYGAKSRNKAKITKYNIYKAQGLYYKGENEKALEWLKVAEPEVEKSEDMYLKMIYASTFFKILFDIGYNDKVEQIYQKNKKIIDKMITSSTNKFDGLYISGLYVKVKGLNKEAYEIFSEAKNYAIHKLQKVMLSFQLAQVCIALSKIEEAEIETENVMNTKKKSKNYLFVYEVLEKIIKETRSQSINISSVDKDLEEQQRKEALDKMNKEVEEAILKGDDKDTKEVKTDENGNIVKEKEIDEDVKKLQEEEAFKEELENLTKNLHNEMLVNNNLNK